LIGAQQVPTTRFKTLKFFGFLLQDLRLSMFEGASELEASGRVAKLFSFPFGFGTALGKIASYCRRNLISFVGYCDAAPAAIR
jgi:hypothetical protein